MQTALSARRGFLGNDRLLKGRIGAQRHAAGRSLAVQVGSLALPILHTCAAWPMGGR